MLYVGFCKHCGWIEYATDNKLFKQGCSSHLKKHKKNFELWVRHLNTRTFQETFRYVRVDEFKEDFMIVRFRNTQLINVLKQQFKSHEFFNKYRNRYKKAEQRISPVFVELGQ